MRTALPVEGDHQRQQPCPRDAERGLEPEREVGSRGHGREALPSGTRLGKVCFPRNVSLLH